MNLRLPRPYTVLAKTQVGDAIVVLCHLPDNDVTPWATWRVNAVDLSCFWGHYHRDEIAARRDFSTRSGEIIMTNAVPVAGIAAVE